MAGGKSAKRVFALVSRQSRLPRPSGEDVEARNRSVNRCGHGDGGWSCNAMSAGSWK